MIEWFTRRAQAKPTDAPQPLKQQQTLPETVDKKAVEKLLQSWTESESLRVLKQAHGIWGNFQYYDSFPPVVLRSRGDVVAIAFRTLNRNGYFNLYDIATNPRHLNRGHGRQLWRLLIAHAHENRSTRIKMGCSPSSVGWHIGNGAVFWGVDEQGSLLCDMPLMPTIEQQLLLQQEAVTNPAVVMPDAKVIAKLRASRGLVQIFA
jgi:hypothetical protein